MSRRVPLFAANWKMFKGPGEARAFAGAFRDAYTPRSDRRLLFFPPAVSIVALVEAFAGRSDIEVGIQDVHSEAEGAHTGAVSARMARDAGARWGLAGHSERRREFGDTDEMVAAKVRRLLAADLIPLVCVGETLEERESGALEEVLGRQLGAVLGAVDSSARARLRYAYEPVWAIGTGRTAEPADAANAHAIVRSLIATGADPSIAEDAVILYGGSVKPTNIGELMAAEGVDGVLVGGASLEADSFARIADVELRS